jgi:hypothetical protein
LPATGRLQTSGDFMARLVVPSTRGWPQLVEAAAGGSGSASRPFIH